MTTLLGVYSRAELKKRKRYHGAVGNCVLVRTTVREFLSTDERSYHCYPLYVRFTPKVDIDRRTMGSTGY